MISDICTCGQIAWSKCTLSTNQRTTHCMFVVNGDVILRQQIVYSSYSLRIILMEGGKYQQIVYFSYSLLIIGVKYQFVYTVSFTDLLC